MNWYTDYRDRLGRIFDVAEKKIAEFPAPIGEIGLSFASKYHPVKREKGQDYICTLLPFWMKDVAGVTDEQCDQFALTNIYLMLYFFIQDDVMDDGPASDVKEKLALATLLYNEMLRMLRKLFPSHSPFWDYFDQYISVWGDSVVNESTHNYFVTNPIRIAHKAGPIKIASTGLLLLGGKAELIPNTEDAVDIALMTLQMADDWVDWKKDIQEGSYNSLVAMIERDLAELHPGSTLTEEAINTHIYVRCCMNKYVTVAQKKHARLLLLNTQVSEVIDFNKYLLIHLNHTAETIENNREMMKKGGLHHFFMTQTTN